MEFHACCSLGRSAASSADPHHIQIAVLANDVNDGVLGGVAVAVGVEAKVTAMEAFFLHLHQEAVFVHTSVGPVLNGVRDLLLENAARQPIEVIVDTSC